MLLCLWFRIRTIFPIELLFRRPVNQLPGLRIDVQRSSRYREVYLVERERATSLAELIKINAELLPAKEKAEQRIGRKANSWPI
jgi:hypothetical protein